MVYNNHRQISIFIKHFTCTIFSYGGNVVDKKLMDYIFLAGIGFRKVTNRKRVFNVIQLMVDFLIGYECIFPLLSSHERFAMIIMLVVLVKIIFHILRRDSIGNFIGIALNTLFIIMSFVFDLGLPIASIIAYIIHILRIKSCYVDRKLKNVYGYPNFNPQFMEMELSKDTLMVDSVKSNYDDLLSDPIIRFSVAESRCGTMIQILKIIGIIMLCAGLLFLYFVDRDMSDYNNSIKVTSLDYCTIGTNITGTVYELYDNCVTGLSKNTNDGYWGVFDDELVLFVVPEVYKSSFAKLYDSYAAEYDLARLVVDGDMNDVSRKTGITFRGRLLAAQDCEFLVEAPYFGGRKLDVPEANTTYFIQVIDGNSARSMHNNGILMIFFGLVIAGGAMVLIYRKIVV